MKKNFFLMLLSGIFCLSSCEKGSGHNEISNPSSKAKISITSATASNSRFTSNTSCHIGVKVTEVTLEEVDAIWCRIETDSNISETKTASGYLYNSLSGTINCFGQLDEGKIYYVQAFVRTEDGAMSKSEVKSFKCGK